MSFLNLAVAAKDENNKWSSISESHISFDDSLFEGILIECDYRLKGIPDDVSWSLLNRFNDTIAPRRFSWVTLSEYKKILFFFSHRHR